MKYQNSNTIPGTRDQIISKFKYPKTQTIVNIWDLVPGIYLGFGIWNLGFKIMCLVFCSLLLNPLNTTAQTKWYKYPGNLEFHGGDSTWRTKFNHRTIIYENGVYKMWYGAWNENNVKTLGIATSHDGINWERHETDSMNFECVKESRNSRFYDFDILKKDSVYYLWYTLRIDDFGTSAIGFAWSKDGIKWAKHPEPVLERGKEDEWDAISLTRPVVRIVEDKFYMWYTAYNKGMPEPMSNSVGLAISADGIHWKKHPSNPVFNPGKFASWDDIGVAASSITYDGTEYNMWYTGTNMVHREIGRATSTDGIHWTRSSVTPVFKFGKPGDKDSWHVSTPKVIYHDSAYRMWYIGNNRTGNSAGYATTSEKDSLVWDTAYIEKQERIVEALVFNRKENINVDSLTNILPELLGKELADASNRLGVAYAESDEIKSLYFADKALQLAGKENYPEGNGVFYFPNGDKYRGQFIHGLEHGKGKLTYLNGRFKSGQWYEGEYLSAQSKPTKGCVKGNCQSGFGTYIFKDDAVYSGAFQNGLPEGKGVVRYENGERYEGHFKQGAFDGFGTLITPKGEKYSGKDCTDIS